MAERNGANYLVSKHQLETIASEIDRLITLWTHKRKHGEWWKSAAAPERRPQQIHQPSLSNHAVLNETIERPHHGRMLSVNSGTVTID